MKYYLAKWKGWSGSTNTWETLQNLCPLLLQQFSTDKHNYLSQVKKGKAISLKDNNKALKPAIAERIVEKMNSTEERIIKERFLNHKGMIFVENAVDLEGPPSDFYYINEYKPAPRISLVNEAAFGCSCTDCFFEKCCPAEVGVLLAHNKNRQIKIPPGTPIYECNSRCHNGCGWGVKTLVKIKRMSFVMEYAGKGITYLFDLDYESDEFTVDAARYGMLHFVNHSFDLNLQVFNVFIDNLDTRLPRIALFSTRTIDDQMKGSSDSVDHSPAKKRVRTVCKCGAVACRGYLN
ncbi:unnamed protein product [Nyctereutes procyonoides]|uniref:Histone-lysine N-methyltransferase n=1 Tax=Nyctereutes procyonoides TaxID=34880 RepID=A0A811XVC3_NYCPR|nr:unnamed protein product [Nyctereutes procyonoides]